MFHFLIIDNDSNSEKVIKRYFSKYKGYIQIHYTAYKNIKEAQDFCCDEKIVVTFADLGDHLQAGGEFWLNLVKKFYFTLSPIVIMSSSITYVFWAKELKNCIDFIMKPIQNASLKKVEQFILDTYDIIHKSDEILKKTMTITTNNEILKIRFDEIYYLETIGRNTKISLKNDTIVIRKSLKSIISENCMYSFSKSHRSFLVNLDKIRSVDKEEKQWNIHFVDMQEVVPLSRGYKTNFMKDFNKIG